MTHSDNDKHYTQSLGTAPADRRRHNLEWFTAWMKNNEHRYEKFGRDRLQKATLLTTRHILEGYPPPFSTSEAGINQQKKYFEQIFNQFFDTYFLYSYLNLEEHFPGIHEVQKRIRTWLDVQLSSQPRKFENRSTWEMAEINADKMVLNAGKKSATQGKNSATQAFRSEMNSIGLSDHTSQRTAYTRQIEKQAKHRPKQLKDSTLHKLSMSATTPAPPDAANTDEEQAFEKKAAESIARSFTQLNTDCPEEISYIDDYENTKGRKNNKKTSAERRRGSRLRKKVGSHPSVKTHVDKYGKPTRAVVHRGLQILERGQPDSSPTSQLTTMLCEQVRQFCELHDITDSWFTSHSDCLVRKCLHLNFIAWARETSAVADIIKVADSIEPQAFTDLARYLEPAFADLLQAICNKQG